MGSGVSSSDSVVSSPPASSSSPSGSFPASVPGGGVNRSATGRSMNCTGTPRAAAQRIATHSGENPASGKKNPAPGRLIGTPPGWRPTDAFEAPLALSPIGYTSTASGGTAVSAASNGSSSSASGGPSINTRSGDSSSSAESSARAQPGPWCRMPSTVWRAASVTGWPCRRGRDPSSRRAPSPPSAGTPANRCDPARGRG